ncbi:MAG: hypothetical protein OYH77_01360 [Pseudomonadota bacterium]|nr:hypothetical protein [Pseudomonadota bacterium]
MVWKIALIAMVFYLWQCRPLGEDSFSDLHSIRSSDDALKIAVNYIGDEHCDDENALTANKKVRNLNSHLLSGKNGELISDEFKQVRKGEGRSNWQSLQFSGDKFFNKANNSASLTLETIKAKCRRLVLSVDSHSAPTIDFAQGFALKDQQQEFQAITLLEFGALECLADAPFCTFANINKGKRYFSLIYPDQAAKKVSATVGWKAASGKTDSATISIPNLTYTGDTPAAWDGAGDEDIGGELTVDLPPAYTAADTSGGGGKGTRPRTRHVFATLTVESAKLTEDNKVKVELTFTANKKIGKGELTIAVVNGSFTNHSENLYDSYTRTSGGRTNTTRTVNYPAGTYGFAGFAQEESALMEFTAPLNKKNMIEFSAKIKRKGIVLSDTKDFEHNGKSTIRVLFGNDS